MGVFRPLISERPPWRTMWLFSRTSAGDRPLGIANNSGNLHAGGNAAPTLNALPGAKFEASTRRMPLQEDGSL